MIKLICLAFLSFGLVACAPSGPCETLCMSSLVEYEPGHQPLPLP